jgi:hypothetical protein
VLLVGSIERHRDFAREQKIAGVAGADFDLIAFTAEAFDGLDEENFCVCHFGIVSEAPERRVNPSRGGFVLGFKTALAADGFRECGRRYDEKKAFVLKRDVFVQIFL